MKKPKILFIMHMPPPVHGAAMMGKYIHDSQLINSSFDCHYINLTTAKDLADIGKIRLQKITQLCKLLKIIQNEVKLFKPQLVYVTPNAKGVAFYKDFILIQMLKQMGCKVIAHYHNKGVALQQDKIINNLMYHAFFKNLKVILLAENLYQDIKKYINYNNVYICPNGIPTHKILPAIPKTEFNILFLSNMMKEKGVWDLVEACTILKKKGKPIKCHFVGKWSDIKKEKFTDEINKRELKECVFAHGAKYGNEKDVFLQEANVFVFPTNNECFPLVLLEAMEQGLPCISTNEGGIPSIIENEKTGYIIEKYSPKIIAEKIEYLMKHPQQCANMGEAGRKKIFNEFTLDKFEVRIKKILEDCIITA